MKATFSVKDFTLPDGAVAILIRDNGGAEILLSRAEEITTPVASDSAEYIGAAICVAMGDPLIRSLIFRNMASKPGVMLDEGDAS